MKEKSILKRERERERETTFLAHAKENSWCLSLFWIEWLK